jgi:hypothetical protein
MKTIQDLTDSLFDLMEGIKDGTITLAQAKEMNKAAGRQIAILRKELRAMKSANPTAKPRTRTR